MGKILQQAADLTGIPTIWTMIHLGEVDMKICHLQQSLAWFPALMGGILKALPNFI